MPEQSQKKELTSPEFKKMLGSLTSYLTERLGLQELPTLKLVESQKNSSDPFGKTGYYDHDKKQITIFITERHDTDILRTFSHEMVHHWQNMRGTLHPEDTGKEAETETTNNDAKPHYAQNNPWLRKREMEAYLFGCMLFRDWQDEQRMGPPSKEPFLPQPYD